MYNTLLAEGQHITSIASSDSKESYSKVPSVIQYIRSNYQNKTAMELKEAASNYLGVGGLKTCGVILIFVQKRTAGAMLTYRKKNGVECGTIGKTGKSCNFLGE